MRPRGPRGSTTVFEEIQRVSNLSVVNSGSCTADTAGSYEYRDGRMNEYKVRTFLLAVLVDIVVRESSPIRNLKDWEASDVRYVPFDVYSSTYRTVSLATILESDLSIITRYYTISKTETFSLAVRCVVRCGTEFVRDVTESKTVRTIHAQGVATFY